MAARVARMLVLDMPLDFTSFIYYVVIRAVSPGDMSLPSGGFRTTVVETLTATIVPIVHRRCNGLVAGNTAQITCPDSRSSW
jgi:hypothetical protein